MKKTLNALITGILVLLSIFLLGIFIPILTSLLLIITSNTSTQDCITSLPFWLFTIVGWIIAAIYVNDELKKQSF